ncbi:cell division initiation protein [Streptomyces sp. NPDC006879]|uniref:cell division initiation protein n=1 Tax=Streptomyces sp. NPDC006879 TaxID=3364767 RepID=UPI0036742591
MDVQKKLDEIVKTVGSARSMPMSASCVVNRAELLAMLEEVRQALPGSLEQARELIGGREQMVQDARAEADRIIESAHSQRGSLISETEVVRQSRGEADRVLTEARAEAEEIRAEADDYVDSKLANFEVVLTKTIGSVDRGREKLLGRGPGLDDHGFADEDAPERSQDPQTLRQDADAYVDAKLGAFEAVLSKTLEAVGRGRQKLLGRVATDDLGAHVAAQDAADGGGRPASDADFLAGLAEPAAPVPPQQPDYQRDTYAYQQEPAQQPDPYAGYPQYTQPEPYPATGGVAVSGGYQGQYDPRQSADPYAYQPQHQDAYGYPQQQAVHPAQPALDETSLFDTSMIDLDQLRSYEQGR